MFLVRRLGDIMQFEAISNIVTDLEASEISYGIIVLENNIELARYEDLTFSKSDIDEFVMFLNSSDIEFMQIEEIVEDFLAI